MQTVFLHGLGQSPASWDRTLACLPGGIQANCPSLPGLLAGCRADYASLSAAFFQYCGGFSGPLRLCGLSLGSVLALDYALACPERVRSLALIAPQYKMPVKLLRLQNLLFRLMPEKAFLETGFGKREFMSLCRSMLPLDFSASAGGLACPVLVLCGEKDRPNRKAAEALAQALPHGRLVTVPQAGHEVNVDQPERLAEILGGFFQNAPDGGGP